MSYSYKGPHLIYQTLSNDKVILLGQGSWGRQGWKNLKKHRKQIKRLIYYCLLFGWELDVVDDDHSDIILRRDTD